MGAPFCSYEPYDTTGDLAYSGNGFAQSAVAKETLSDTQPAFAPIHEAAYANDGSYGNASSWIDSFYQVNDGISTWLKIDLGRTASIDQLTFGRDRLGGYDDRDPGQFTIEVALSDNIYANGNDNNDAIEYTQIVDSSLLGFSGVINGPETIQASFDPVLARYVKLTFSHDYAAIDEVQIFGSVQAVASPSTLLLLAVGFLGLVVRCGRCKADAKFSMP